MQTRPMHCPSLALAAVLAFWLPPILDAQEWTRFRGPNGTGVHPAASLPVRWTEKNIHWKTALPGVGHSSPVVWGQRIFVTSAEDEGRRRSVLCLGAEDGEMLWSRDYTLSTHRKHRFNSFASSSPAVDAERVYVTFVGPGSYGVHALDHDGKDLWQRDLGSWESQHGHGASPIVLGEHVILTNDQLGASTLLALDAETGRTVWEAQRRSDRAAYGTPCVVERDGKIQLLLTSRANGISSHDARTGRMLWEAPLFTLRTVSSPVVWGDLVIGTCGSGGGGNYLVAVRLGGEGDVSETHLAYRLNRSIPYVATPIVLDGLLFLFSDKGIASCVEVATGDVVWQERLGDGFYSSPVSAGGRIYCISREGEVVVLRAGREFDVLARNSLGDQCHATPAIAGGRMYIRTFGHLMSVGEDPDS